MPLKKPTIVIFDMDGTAVRHMNPWVLPLLERLDDAYYTLSKFFGWIFKRRSQDPLLPPPDYIKPRKKPRLLVHRAIHKVRRKEVDQIVEPCPGIYDVLDLLREHDIPMAMVSNGLGKGYGHDILKKFDLEDYFAAAIFREDIHKSKPNPEALMMALKQLNIHESKNDVVWYIGDRHKDVLATLALGEQVAATIVPIAYGMNAALAVIEKGFGPDHIFISYFDMLGRLERLLGNPPAKKKPQSPLSSRTQPVDRSLGKGGSGGIS